MPYVYVQLRTAYIGSVQIVKFGFRVGVSVRVMVIFISPQSGSREIIIQYNTI